MDAVNPLMDALAGSGRTPEPRDCVAVLAEVDKLLLVPHSNHAEVASPFGFAVPLRTAEFARRDVAAVVVTVGGEAGGATVVKFQVPEYAPDPELLDALTRQ